MMGGDICITEKGRGERGTCFRFIVPLELAEFSHSKSLNPISSSFCSTSSFSSRSPKQKQCLVLILIKSDERRRVVTKYMRSLGMRVVAGREWWQLCHIFKNMNTNPNLSPCRSDQDTPYKEEEEEEESVECGGCVLLLIDLSTEQVGPEKLNVSVFKFRHSFRPGCCKVVWLDKQNSGGGCNNKIPEQRLPQGDRLISKPFHGYRMMEVVRLLPEFRRGRCSPPSSEQGEATPPPVRISVVGKRVLVVEDNPIGMKLVTSVLSGMGVTPMVCANGRQAVDIVCQGLRQEEDNLPPFDCLFMDCEMPVMDGYMATEMIREEEEKYGVRIPIIALTSHDDDEVEKMAAAGMDGHLVKPPTPELLLAAFTLAEECIRRR